MDDLKKKTGPEGPAYLDDKALFVIAPRLQTTNNALVGPSQAIR